MHLTLGFLMWAHGKSSALEKTGRYSGKSSICFSIDNSNRFTIGVSRFGHGDARTAKTHITRHTVTTWFIVLVLFNLKMKKKQTPKCRPLQWAPDWRSSRLDASIKYKAGAWALGGFTDLGDFCHLWPLPKCLRSFSFFPNKGDASRNSWKEAEEKPVCSGGFFRQPL